MDCKDPSTPKDENKKVDLSNTFPSHMPQTHIYRYIQQLYIPVPEGGKRYIYIQYLYSVYINIYMAPYLAYTCCISLLTGTFFLPPNVSELGAPDPSSSTWTRLASPVLVCPRMKSESPGV